MTDTSDKALLALADRLDAPEYWLSGSDAGHEGENSAPVEAAAALRAIVAERQAGAQVKPLVWHNYDAWTYWAESTSGTYHIEERNGGWNVSLRFADRIHVIAELDPEMREETFEAAQADHEARIRAALKGPNDDQ